MAIRTTRKNKTNINQVNLMVDLAIFGAFLVAMAPRFSGLAIHEWLSLAFGAALFVHLLLHWQWIVEITKRFFKNAAWMARINYVLNSLLFITMTVVMLSGLLISEIALPTLGIPLRGEWTWRQIHTLSADAVLVLVGLHIALHWQWVVDALKRYVPRPFAPKAPAKATPPPPQEHP